MKTAFLFILNLCMLTTFSHSQTEQNNNSLDNSFANPTNLSDQQMDNAKNFVHKGIKDRTIQEGCAQKGLKNCTDNQSSFPVEEAISKVYALIFGGLMGGGTPTVAWKSAAETGTEVATEKVATETTDGASKATEAKENTKPDYCMYGAMAYEVLGGMIQQGLQNKADQSAQAVGDIQLQSLVNLKETHKARKKTATWQAGVYGTISACYGVMLYSGADTADWKIWAKMGGAIALTTLYLKKANKHASSAKKVQAIIDALPKSGDCNPWTGTSCFCKELTSKTLYPAEYEEVCVLNNGNFDTPKVALGCGTVVDNKMQFDKECKCKQTNTCYKMNLKSYSPNFDIGSNFMNEANKGFDLLSNGEFDEGKIAQFANGTAALSSRLKGKGVTMPNIKLNQDQLKVADALKPVLGPLAPLAAVSPAASPRGGIIDSPALKATANLDKLNDANAKEAIAEAIKAKYKSGAGFSASSKSNEPVFSFPNLMGQPEQASGNTEILTFAEQAVSKADVSNAPETPIFDIISNRYRRSGWTKLEPQSEKK